jgi:diacylglycerol kinase (ATP)
LFGPLCAIERYYNTGPMRVGVVINPISGRRGSHAGEAERRRAFVLSHSAALGVDAVVLLTERGGHARQLAQQCVDDGCAAVIAMGGDGTVNEVAQALVGTSVALGIVPCGSGDGLARGLKLPTDMAAALRVALMPAATAIDVGYAGGHLFLNIAGVGFDASVAKLFSTRAKRGAWGYVMKSLQLVFNYRAPDYEVRWQTISGEEIRRGRKFLVGFANGAEYGNRAVMAPDADYSDGLLDVLIVEAGNPLQQIWRSRRLFWGYRRPAAGVERARATHASIHGQSIVYHLDGEVFETSGSLDIRLRPQSLLVRIGTAGSKDPAS